MKEKEIKEKLDDLLYELALEVEGSFVKEYNQKTGVVKMYVYNKDGELIYFKEMKE